MLFCFTENENILYFFHHEPPRTKEEKPQRAATKVARVSQRKIIFLGKLRFAKNFAEKKPLSGGCRSAVKLLQC
jgi:hypothetical protein